MAGVIMVSEPFWAAPFTGLRPCQFGKLITALRREGADPVRKGRLWSLALEGRVLLVAAYGRTSLALRQLAPLFGISRSAADRIVGRLGPSLALRPRKRFRKDSVLTVGGTLVPTRGHTTAEQPENYRYSTNHQVVTDAGPRLPAAVGRPLPGNRHGCKARELSGVKDAAGKTTVNADSGYRGTGPVIPHHRKRDRAGLPAWKEEHNASHRKARTRIEHASARMKSWKTLRGCRLKDDGIHHTMLSIARLHNHTPAG